MPRRPHAAGRPGSPAARDDQPVHRDVALYGPGDIVGIDRARSSAAEPRHWITNFEPNYLPYVEFYDEDFPWRYTPAAADVGAHRLRPWIALVVLKESEFTEGKDLTGQPLPYFELAAGVDAAACFPPADRAVGLGARARQRRPLGRTAPSRLARHGRGAAAAAGHDRARTPTSPTRA